MRLYPDHGARLRGNKRWKRLRWEILKRDSFKCRKCGAIMRLEVDHIIPVKDRPDLAYAKDNLQTLCRPRHSFKTQLETRGITVDDADRLEWRKLLRTPI